MALDPGGGGEFVPGDQEQCHFGKLNEPELRHICQFLHWKDHLRMMQLCNDFKDYFEYIYGIHAYLPPRNFNLAAWSIIKLCMGRLAGTTRQVTDAMLRQTILNLEGKVIRSMEMTELHPDFNPFPFERLIHFPFRLREVSLKYVDVQFLIKILSSCRNLTTFHYETGLQRHLPQGPLAWLLLKTSFQPVPIPLGNEQLLEFLTQLPTPTFQVERLTSLSLSIQTINSQFHSDWANIVFLLLSLSSANLCNLKKFKFSLQFGYRRTNPKDRLQIVACVGQFLSRCPSLQKLDYTSCLPAERNWILLGEQVDRDRLDTETGLPQNVLSGLIQKYGSDLLKEVLGPNTLGSKQRMLAPIRQIMQEAGRSLRSVRDASFQFVNRMEPDVFQHLLSTLPSPSIESINVDDYSGPRLSDPNYYKSLLPSMEQQHYQEHAYQRIERLCVHRCCDFEPSRNENDIDNISISKMLGVMRSLKRLELTLRTPFEDTQLRIMEDEWEGIVRIHEPIYDLQHIVDIDEIEDGNDDLVEGGGRTPDMIIEEVADATLFHRVEILKLKGVKITVEDAARLSQWRNLKELILVVLPEYRHELFGIRSEDLLRMMGSLRRLNKLSVNMIYLPQEASLNLVHRTALQEIGSLTEMHHFIRLWQPPQGGQGWIRNYETRPMTQYKFSFNCDEINEDNNNGMMQ